MCKILLSINPEHVVHILDGSKEYEFRKIRCKEDVDGIIIYATAPIKQVVAEADIEAILEDTPEEVWSQTEEKSGISSKFFFDYYKGKTKAIAYKLTNLNKFEKPKTLADYGVSAAPQSFVYVSGNA
jgi:predicted transcriptional regulator